MELLAVRTARLIAYLNAEELNPLGRPIAHDYMRAFVERYKFTKQPTTADEILDSKGEGITFEVGKFGDVGINKVSLFNWGVVVETSASTEASEAVLSDILSWGAETFQMSDRPSLITRRNFVSEIVFSSDMQLPTVSPKLKAVGDKITELAVYRLSWVGFIGFLMPHKQSNYSRRSESSDLQRERRLGRKKNTIQVRRSEPQITFR